MREIPRRGSGSKGRALLAPIIGISLIGPIRGKIRGQNENAEFREAKFVKRRESGAEVGATFHRAATTIDNEIRGTWKRGGPGLKFLEAGFISRSAVVLRALDVARSVKALEAHKQNSGCDFGIIEFLEQIRRLNSLRYVPGVRSGAQRNL